MDDRKLSPHFSLFDLTRTDQADLQEENRHISNDEESKLVQVANLLELCRIIIGCDIDVHSGRRYLVLNQRVGGSVRSQHLKCEAADFSPQGPDTQESIDAAFDKLVVGAKQAKGFKFGQLISESQNSGREGKKLWLHISLATPYRDLSRCGEILKMIDGKYTLIGRII